MFLRLHSLDGTESFVLFIDCNVSVYIMNKYVKSTSPKKEPWRILIYLSNLESLAYIQSFSIFSLFCEIQRILLFSPRAAHASEDVMSLRPPRFFGDDGVIRPYRLRDGAGSQMLQVKEVNPQVDVI